MPSCGADRVGGDGHALEHAVGERLQQHAVHERAGVALVAVADDVFRARRGLPDQRATCARSGSRRRRARAGRCASDWCRSVASGERRLGTLAAGTQPSGAGIRPGRAGRRGRSARWRGAAAGPGTRRPVLARIDARPAAGRPLVGQTCRAATAGRDRRSRFQSARRYGSKWRSRSGLRSVAGRSTRGVTRRARGGGRLQAGVDGRRFGAGRTTSTSGVWWHMPTQPTGLTTAGSLGARAGSSIDLAAHLGAAAGDAAGARRPMRICALTAGMQAAGGPCGGPDCGRRALRLEEVVDQRCRHDAGGQVAVGDAVDLHHRRQRAAAEAGDPLEGEPAVAVGVLAVVEPQVPAAGPRGPGRAPLTWQAVPWQTLMMCCPTGSVAELGVEGGDAGDGRGGDVGRSQTRSQGLGAAGSGSAPGSPAGSGSPPQVRGHGCARPRRRRRGRAVGPGVGAQWASTRVWDRQDESSGSCSLSTGCDRLGWPKPPRALPWAIMGAGRWP